jgi:hypothetical protein
VVAEADVKRPLVIDRTPTQDGNNFAKRPIVVSVIRSCHSTVEDRKISSQIWLAKFGLNSG